MSKERARIKWIDIAKGIAIVMVILGHTVKKGEPAADDIIRGIIFSFHMPMFVVLSCITTSLSQDETQFLRRTEKSFKRLVIPAIIVYCVIVVTGIVRFGIDGSRRLYLANIINTFVFASGVEVTHLKIKAMGMLWFLIFLYLGRTLYDYLSLRCGQKQVGFICILIAIAGYCFTQVQWLPFSFDLVMFMLPFMHMGAYMKKYRERGPSIIVLLGSFAIWSALFWFIYHKSGHYFELAARDFPLLPLSYICAIAGTIFAQSLSKYINKIPFISDGLAYIGKMSMEIYLVHALDWYLIGIWGSSHNTYAIACLRIITDIAVAAIYVEIKKVVIGLSDR